MRVPSERRIALLVLVAWLAVCGLLCGVLTWLWQTSVR